VHLGQTEETTFGETKISLSSLQTIQLQVNIIQKVEEVQKRITHHMWVLKQKTQKIWTKWLNYLNKIHLIVKVNQKEEGTLYND